MESDLTRRSFNSLALSAALSCSISPLKSHALTVPDTHQFVHPGMLHAREDIVRMRQGVRAHRDPIMSGFKVFQQHPNSQPNYMPLGPVATIGRNPTVHVDLFDNDSNAAYQCALMWSITGNHAYARLAIRILNGWASALKQITGADAVLCASLGGFKLINAAELIRHTHAGWGEADVQQAEDFFRFVLLPVLHNFAPFANGNWDTAAIKCMMAIGIFCEDDTLVDNALRYYLHGCGDGRLENYIYPGGQCQESGRDQQHTQLGLAHMGDTCEMAWNQGLDLYGAVANRLLEGFEYAARYNLGSDVTFVPDHDKTGKYSHDVISPRSSLRPVYEQIYNHYVHRKGATAPFTQHAAEALRPEGAARGADHTGFGTLLYSRQTDDRVFESTREKLAALYLSSSANEIRLEWVPSYLATSYAIGRSDSESTVYRSIAANVAEPTYKDRDVIAGHSYSYRVSPTGNRKASRQVSSAAGLPPNWSERSYGEAFPAGSANITSGDLVIQAYGSRAFGNADEFHFVFSALSGDGKLTARLSPLLASQRATVGLMLRTEGTNGAPMTALAISADSIGERPLWTVSLLCREATDPTVRTLNALPLDVPFTAYGRIVRPVWMRLSRNHHELRAYLSYDGRTWTDVGTTFVAEKQILAGCFACSGLGSISTEVTFQQLELKRLQSST